MGIIITTPLASIMIERGFLGGWPSAFYVFGRRFLIFIERIIDMLFCYSGILSIIWFIGWSFFTFNSPEVHPRISDKERLFLNKEVPPRPKKVRQRNFLK